jgi:hypothetical protein
MRPLFWKDHTQAGSSKLNRIVRTTRKVLSLIAAIVTGLLSATPVVSFGEVQERGFQVGLTDAITPETVLELKQEWGINLARIQIGDNSRMDGAVGDAYRDLMERAFDRFDSKLPFFEQNNIKVVFALYSTPGGFQTRGSPPHHMMFSDPQLQQEFISIWETIIDRYGNNPAIYAFDLSNEPAENKSLVCGTCKPWVQLVKDVISAIRAKNSSVRLIIKPPYANPVKLGQMPIINDPLIIYNYHSYPFHRYQHAGLPGVNAPPTRPAADAIQRAVYSNLRGFLSKWDKAYKRGEVSSPLPSLNVGEVAVSACAFESGLFLDDMLTTIEGNFDSIDGDALKVSCRQLKKKARDRCYKRAKLLKRRYPLVAAIRKAHTSWTYHGFNDAEIWDARYACSPSNQFFLSPTETDRETVLKAQFSRNSR